MNRGKQSAFPSVLGDPSLTKQEIFAMAAMQAIASQWKFSFSDPKQTLKEIDNLTGWAVTWAIGLCKNLDAAEAQNSKEGV